MPRPKLTERVTIRLPEELLIDCQRAAGRRSCSLNELCLNALENELARIGTYSLDYYGQLRPLLQTVQGDNGRQLFDLSDTN